MSIPHRFIAISALVVAGACTIDFGADVPCEADGDCPRAQVCNLDFFRCVDGDGTPDADSGQDTGRDTNGDTPGDLVDVPGDAPVDGDDAATDVPSDSTGDAPVDGSGDGGGDTGGDTPADVPVDGGCVPTGPEVCDGTDNDCNGIIDDPPVCDSSCGTGMLVVDQGDGTTFCIDIYEASRPDATSDSPGSTSTTATSRSGVIPWSTVSLAEAGASCEAAGKRLCSAFEWQTACQGTSLALYPYGNAYRADACNGSNAPPLDGPAPTGQFSECVSADGTFDQSGNLAEWTTDGILRGGAFADPQLNLRCSSRTTDPGGAPLPNFGFRCCKDAP